MTYMDFTCDLLKQMPIGTPIYTGQIAERMADRFTLEFKDAAAATSVAVKRIMILSPSAAAGKSFAAHFQAVGG